VLSGHHRFAVAGLVLGALLVGLVLLAYAATACPGPAADNPCRDAAVHRGAVVSLAAIAGGLLVAPFAFLAEFATRRRIVYRGAWGRAIRRGMLVSILIGALGALRLGGALSVPVVLFLVVVAAVVEWSAIRRFDLP
jgi:hypothetical protein